MSEQNILTVEEPSFSDNLDNYVVGIDLGTTNSLVAYYDGGNVVVIPDSKGNLLLPSAVFYDKGTKQVGYDALVHPKAIMSIKRLMGCSLDDIHKVSGYYRYELDTSHKDGLVRLIVDDKKMNPVSISADILLELRIRAEKYLKGKLRGAVITVPAYFKEAAKIATKDAARLAGIDVLRIVAEPTAAAMAYGLEQDTLGKYLVYDLGGGTFDVSLLQYSDSMLQVMAVSGDNFLGGDDFDNAIVESFLSYCEVMGITRAEVMECYTITELCMKAKIVKEILSKKHEVDFSIYINGQDLKYQISRRTFNAMITPYIRRTYNILLSVLNDANVSNDEINGIILVGGSTRILAIRETLHSKFNSKIFCDVNPDEVVVFGAALYAYNLVNAVGRLTVDVLPLSLGIEIDNGLMDVIIPRNTQLPSSNTRLFTTQSNDHNSIKVSVYQGERSMVKDNHFLTTFDIKDISCIKLGSPRVHITFLVDVDGLFTVVVYDENADSHQYVKIDCKNVLTEKEIDAMLSDAKENHVNDIMLQKLIEIKSSAINLYNSVIFEMKNNINLLSTEKEGLICHKSELLHLILDSESANTQDIELAMSELENVSQEFLEDCMNKKLEGINVFDKEVLTS